jgi:hypothetical protein
LALAYKHPVEFSKNNHTPTTTPQQGHNRGNLPNLLSPVCGVKYQFLGLSFTSGPNSAHAKINPAVA